MKHQQSIIFCTHQLGEIVSIIAVLGRSWDWRTAQPTTASVMLCSGRDWVQVVKRQCGPHQATRKCFPPLITMHVKHYYSNHFMMLQQSSSSGNHRNGVAEGSHQLPSHPMLIRAAWREGNGTRKICMVLLFLTWCTSFFHKILNTKLRPQQSPKEILTEGMGKQTEHLHPTIGHDII